MGEQRPEAADVTGLLQAWRSGDSQAGDRLLERIYQELKRIAASQLRRERSDHLAGDLFIDRFSHVKRLAIRGKLKRLKDETLENLQNG